MPRLPAVLLACLALLATPEPARGQQLSLPGAAYFDALMAYRDGDLTGALKSMRHVIAGNAGSRSAIEVLCYHSLAGECLYQMGDLPGAMEQFTASLRTWQTVAGFMLHCTFPTQQLEPDPSVVRPPITWAGRSRAAQRVRLSPTFHIHIGGLANMGRSSGGQLAIATQTSAMPIEGIEILRCVALSMRRRAELLGTLAKVDPLTASIGAQFSQPLAAPNHYSNVWIQLLKGLNEVAAGRPQEAAVSLQSSMLIGGMEHPLTCIAPIELGKLAREQGALEQAQRLFLDATFSAAEHQNGPAVAEAFRYGMLTHLERGERSLWQPLLAAVAWSRAARTSRTMSVSLMASLAENLAAGGASADVLKLFDQARREAGRHSIAQGMQGARIAFQAALASYQLGNGAAADQAFQQAMPTLIKGSHKNYQIALAEQLHSQGAIGGRAAAILFEQLLQDPEAKDWMREPSEALAWLLAPNEYAMEHWFQLALDRKEWEQALDISDFIRRRRFFGSLPLGGRLVAMRWILEAPESMLSDQGKLERQQFMNTRPAYAQLSKQARAVRDKLDAIPLDAMGADHDEQVKLLEQLGTISTAQEVALRALALDRTPSELMFPPRLKSSELQQKLQPNQALLSYFTTSKQVHGFALTKTGYFSWQVASPRAVKENLSNLLKEIGCRKANLKLPAELLNDTAWKESAAKVREGLFPKDEGDTNVWDQVDELVIVPDGVLWYLPFEILPHDAGGSEMLIERKRVRYVPLISLGWPDPLPRNVNLNTAVIAQRVMPTDTVDQSQAAAKKLADIRGGVAAWDHALPGPSSLIAALAQQVIVWSNLPDTPSSRVHDWSPMLLDRGRPGSTMASWLALPWGGAREIALPGFHSHAESGAVKGDGSELFLAACALMADGARTVVLSRWTVGGESTRDIIREAMQEMPHVGASRWSRAIQLHRGNNKIDPRNEPRLTANGELAKGDHPLLWAGYLLIDTGETPAKP